MKHKELFTQETIEQETNCFSNAVKKTFLFPMLFYAESITECQAYSCALANQLLVQLLAFVPEAYLPPISIFTTRNPFFDKVSQSEPRTPSCRTPKSLQSSSKTMEGSVRSKAVTQDCRLGNLRRLLAIPGSLMAVAMTLMAAQQ